MPIPEAAAALPGPPAPFLAIGEIRTAHTRSEQTPVQTALNPHEQGRAEIADPFLDGLSELDGFDHAWLVSWLGLPSDPVPLMRQVPFLLGPAPRPIGVFAMRGPRRPNPIGLHLVRIVEFTATGFVFAGVDMIDRTPLLDIKPWAASLDLPPGTRLDRTIRSGWFDTADLSEPHTPASLG